MFDLLTIGRISVDIYGQEEGAGLADPQTFHKAVGGSPTNVAIGTARLGHKAGVITGVADDSLGNFALAELDKFKVSTEFVSVLPGKTPVVLAGLKIPDNPELIFYRDPDAPDTQMDLSPGMKSAVTSSRLFWYTGSTLSHPKLRNTVHALLESRPLIYGKENIFDLDYRPSFWKDELEAHKEIFAAIKYATVVIGNRKEAAVATGLPVETRLEEFARVLIGLGARLAIIKDGANGVFLAHEGRSEMVPGIRVKTRCGLGAGDAFGAGVVHGLLEGWRPEESIRFANAAGAYVASQLMCSDAMPTQAQVLALMDKS